MILQSVGGAIYAYEEPGIGIGFYPQDKALVFVIFELRDGKLRKIERRAIYVTEKASKELIRAIEICILNNDEFIKKDEPTTYHF